MLRLPFVFILSAGLIGCAISEQSCKEGDWASIGLKDGLRGLGKDKFAVYDKECSKYGVKPIFSEWDAARKQGLLSYCTPLNAFDLGKEGRNLRPNCPPELMASLSSANRFGKQLFEISEEIEELEIERDQKSTLLASLAEDDPSRSSIIAEIRRLDSDIRKLNSRYRFKERHYLNQIS